MQHPARYRAAGSRRRLGMRPDGTVLEDVENACRPARYLRGARDQRGGYTYGHGRALTTKTGAVTRIEKSGPLTYILARRRLPLAAYVSYNT